MSAGILGTSYSGSTILSFVLGGHSHIFAVSETTTLKRDGQGAECTMCKYRNQACPFWTRELLDDCLANMRQRYGLIERAALQILGKDLTLFSDKAPAVYRPLLAHSTVDRFIVMFKQPESFFYSYRKHRRLNQKFDSDRQICDTYVRHYRNDFALLDDTGFPGFFLYYDDFCRNPVRVTQQLCGFLGVDYEPAMMRYWESNLHTLTGNMGPYMNVLDGEELERLYAAKSIYLYDRTHLDWHAGNKRTIALDERWRTELSAEQLRAVERHDEVQAMFATLMERRRQAD